MLYLPGIPSITRIIAEIHFKSQRFQLLCVDGRLPKFDNVCDHRNI